MSKNQLTRSLRAALLRRAWLAVILSAGLLFSGVVTNGGAPAVASFAVAAQSDGSEKPISRLVSNAKAAGQAFPSHELFEAQAQSVADSASAWEAVQAGTILALKREAIPAILDAEVSTFTLPLPAAGGPVELELVKAKVLTPDFAVFTNNSKGLPVPVEEGAHYRGVVKGDPNSLAAVSIFRDEVMALYSTEKEGNFILGRLEEEDALGDHILYAEKDLKEQIPFTCDTKDDGRPYTLDELQEQPTGVISRCVRIYVEADYDLFVNRGSDIPSVVNFVTGFFNQSATIFANEGIPISLSELFVWTSPSPYTGTDTLTLLTQFQSFRNSFNGDFGHLINLQNVGGRAAGFSGFCNANIDARQCVSGIDNFYNNVPTYSWTIYVFTHEMGHLMGSRHTHACVWNGNGTAIDGCSGATEGGCPLPGIPSGGGTIMSYCHLTGVGINFTLGFGPQPGNVIRSRYNAASCLVSCTVDVARLQINLTNNTFVNSTGGAASFVVSPSGGRTVVKVTLNPSLNGFSKARFTVTYNSTPTNWTVNIGDSSTNNGGGGDAATQSNDAEVQVLNTTMTALGRDATPPPKNLVDVPSFVANGRTVIIEVSNNFVGWSSLNGSGTLNSIYLYALNGQADSEGPVNYDIYAAFNRVISDTSRTGTGVGSVTIDLLP
jgi:hypothetical protein